MAKRYLGYGYTNAQGIAKLEFDPDGEPLTHSYTGVGAGIMDIVAESGNLESDPYQVYDCLLYAATEENITGAKEYKNPGVSGSYTWDYPFCWDLEVQSVSNPSNHVVRVFEENSTSASYWAADLSALGISDNAYHTLQVKVYQDVVSYSLDGGVPVEVSKNFTGGKLRINFATSGSGSPSTNVKNVKVYPI